MEAARNSAGVPLAAGSAAAGGFFLFSCPQGHFTTLTYPVSAGIFIISHDSHCNFSLSHFLQMHFLSNRPFHSSHIDMRSQANAGEINKIKLMFCLVWQCLANETTHTGAAP